MKKYSVYFFVGIIGIAIFFLQFNYVHKYQPHNLYQVYLDDEKIGVIVSKEELEDHISSQGNIIQDQVIDYQNQVERIKSVHEVMEKRINRKTIYYREYLSLLNLEKIYRELSSYVEDDGKIKDGCYDKLVALYSGFSSEYTDKISISSSRVINYDILDERFNSNIKKLSQEIVNYLYDYRDSLNMTSSEYSDLEDYVNQKLYDVEYSKFLTMQQYVEDNAIYLHTSDVYEPLGINVKKITTYDTSYTSVSDVYNKIIDKKPCTIEGYQFRIKSGDSSRLPLTTLLGALTSSYDPNKVDSSNDVLVYVTDVDVFKDAIDEVTKVFVGSEKYEAYLNNTQQPITTTGSIINNIYLQEEITMKKTNISVKERIFTDSSSLASYLLYGDQVSTKIVKASAKDTVDDLAYRNGISVEEFFLSNPSFTSVNNMFYDGQNITITKLNPKISLVVQESEVVEQPIYYKTIEKEDHSMTTGSEYVYQKGQNGLMRVSRTVEKVNGSTTKLEVERNEQIKAAKDRIIYVGTRNVPSIGSVRNWLWPTNSYTISSYFGYRRNPFNPKRSELHPGLDISNKAGSPVYASNNGTIYAVNNYSTGYGKHIIIDHNNGYYTLYGHMRGFAKGMKVGTNVARGQVIGYVGMTGAATGNHVHFEIRVGTPNGSGATNPLPYLRK